VDEWLGGLQSDCQERERFPKIRFHAGRLGRGWFVFVQDWENLGQQPAQCSPERIPGAPSSFFAQCLERAECGSRIADVVSRGRCARVSIDDFFECMIEPAAFGRGWFTRYSQELADGRKRAFELARPPIAQPAFEVRHMAAQQVERDEALVALPDNLQHRLRSRPKRCVCFEECTSHRKVDDVDSGTVLEACRAQPRQFFWRMTPVHATIRFELGNL
jgi:hypothetical protein